LSFQWHHLFNEMGTIMMELSSFAHNWNNGTMEQWKDGIADFAIVAYG
jgi:hypothetical protein